MQKLKTAYYLLGKEKHFQYGANSYEKFKVTAKRKSNIHRSSLKWENKLNN